jgi:uncharacterized protein YukJ
MSSSPRAAWAALVVAALVTLSAGSGSAQLRNYGVLKGRLVEYRLASDSAPHVQIHVTADGAHYRIALNTRSQTSAELRVATIEHFSHAITSQLERLPDGRTSLPAPGLKGLDYIRSGLFRIEETQFLGQAAYVGRLRQALSDAERDAAARVYAFGNFWPESGTDRFFGFQPGRGIHDVHLNQGNRGPFAADDGVFQDGALFIHLPSSRQWWAIFAMFASQSLTTHDVTGRAPADGFSTLPGATPSGTVNPAPVGPREEARVPRATTRYGVVVLVMAIAGALIGGFIWLTRSRAPRTLHIFISYRREDLAHARLICDRIRGDAELKRATVFWDIDSLTAGKNYRDAIERAIGDSDAFIALVGPAWTERVSELQGQDDVLRGEVAYALTRGVPVIPVIIEGARLPAKADLPSDIRPLADLQQLVLPHLYFEEGMQRLLDQLRGVAAQLTTTTPVTLRPRE